MRWFNGCVLVLLVGCASQDPTGGAETAGAGGVAAPGSGGEAGSDNVVTPGGGGGGGASTGGSSTGGSSATGTGGSPTGDGGHGTGGAAGSQVVSEAGVTAGHCSALAAANTWESITPAGVTWSDAIVVDPFDASITWLGTKGSGLFKSTDCGASWSNVSTGRNGALMATGEMVSMAVDPTTPGVIYATSWTGAEGVWKSVNGGIDWDKIFPTPALANVVNQNSEMSSIGMEPGNPKHLIVSAHSPCNPPYKPICLAETSDGGATWRIVSVPGPNASPSGNWTNYMPGAGAFILDASTWLFSSYSDGLWLTTDDGATWRNVTAQGAQGATGGKTLNHPFVPSPAGTYYLVSGQGMLSSSDGRSWSLIPNSGGSAVGFAMGGGHIYAANQWSVTYNSAAQSNDKAWTTMVPPPAPMYQTFPQGGVYLAYDEAHHILFSSNWFGGVWRQATP